MRPSTPRTKLDPAALATLEGTRQGLAPAGGNRGKLLVPLGSLDADAVPVPLHRVYLVRDTEGSPRIEPLGGLEAVTELVEDAYYLRQVVGLGLAGEWFRTAAALAQKVQVARLLRPRGFQHLPRLVELLESEARRIS